MPPSRSRARRRLLVFVRRIHRRIDRSSAFVTSWLATWGVSLAIHGVGILVLALIYFVQPLVNDRVDLRGVTEKFAPLGEDLTSLVPAERAGDPFTTSTSNEFPSMGLPTVDPNLKTTAQPRSMDGARFTASVSLPSPNVVATGVKLTDVVGVRPAGALHVENLSAPFSGRDPLMKAKLIRRQGGTVESEKAVAAGLEWLARHQKADGSWSLDCHSACKGEGCPQEAAMVSDVAATGLAILPMLGAGHIHTKEGRYQENIRRGLAWLMKQQKRDGELFTEGTRNTLFYTHSIGTMALCEAYGLSKDPKLRVAAQRGLNYLAKNQNLDDGGWRYFTGQPGDTSVFGWSIFALRSGRLAGFSTQKSVTDRCRKYLGLAQTDDRGVTYAYLPRGPITPVMTAEALLCRQYLGWPKDYPAMVEGARLVAADLRTSQERNIYYWYYATQMLHNMQNKDWKDWNAKLREGLIAMQRQGTGCDRGSWDPNFPQPDREGRRAGRLYTTALSVLTLEVYYRFLPLYHVPGDDDGTEDEPKTEPKAAP